MHRLCVDVWGHSAIGNQVSSCPPPECEHANVQNEALISDPSIRLEEFGTEQMTSEVMILSEIQKKIVRITPHDQQNEYSVAYDS